MKYARIIAEVYGRAWALPEATLLVMRDLLIQRVIGGAEWSAEEIRERIDASNEKNGYAPRAREEARYLFADGTAASEWDDMPMRAASGKRNAAAPGSVAVIPIVGIVSNRMSMMGDLSGSGGASAQKITLQFRQALEDGNCKAIVFDVDSPGGSVEGVAELASEIPGSSVWPVDGDHTACISTPEAFVPVLISACQWVTTRADDAAGS